MIKLQDKNGTFELYFNTEAEVKKYLVTNVIRFSYLNFLIIKENDIKSFIPMLDIKQKMIEKIKVMEELTAILTKMVERIMNGEKINDYETKKERQKTKQLRYDLEQLTEYINSPELPKREMIK